MRTAHPREQLGNRLICDSLAISYSRDIDGTIAEEDEEEEDTGSRSNSNSRNRRNDGDRGGDDDDAMSNGHAALLEQVVIGADRNRRSVSSTSRSGGSGRGRGQSRSVSPGARTAGGQQPQQHDYVNSAPGSRFLEDTMAIPAIPPPPQSSAKFQKQHQLFSVQPAAAGADSDPYGKEFDAIGSRVPATATTAVIPSSTGSRINGRVLPPEARKEAIPPRLRNGFVPGNSGGSGGF